MNLKTTLTTSTIAAKSLIAFLLLSPQESLDTIEQCASLLPSGYKYSMTIQVEIDTVDGQPKMVGNLELTDGTQNKRSEVTEEIAPFTQCVVSLIK